MGVAGEVQYPAQVDGPLFLHSVLIANDARRILDHFLRRIDRVLDLSFIREGEYSSDMFKSEFFSGD